MTTVNVVFGSTGQRSMFQGLDLSSLRQECALGETPILDKEIQLSAKKYLVSDLLVKNVGLKYDLILRMMLDRNIITEQTKVQIGCNGQLYEVYLCNEKEAYRIFRTKFYGKVRG